MMNCEAARSVADSWENGGIPVSLDEFKAHLDACDLCSERFGSLLPLMERDLAPARAPVSAPADLADAVMASLESASGRPKAPSVFYPLVATAAAAIFVLGLSLGIFLARRDTGVVTVKFMLEAPQASTVFLAGDFNAWDGERYQMRRVGASGTWEIAIPLQKNKVYVYNFVLDGKTWIVDPAVPAKIDDGFGGKGSLLRI
jgi:hypothetical protein